MTISKLFALIFSLLCIVLIICTACVPPWQSDAALFLEDLAVGNEGSRLKGRTPTPTKISIEYEIRENQYHADLYISKESTLAGIVLIPGIAKHGRDDPRLVAFATTLARSHFMVLVPDIPNLRDLKVRAEDSRTIADAFTYLISRPEFPVEAQAGIGAFSYAVGPAVLAALEPIVREKVDFVLGVGGYYDVEHVITFFTTGYFQNKNKWHHLEPNEYGKWVFIISNVERLSDPNDKNIFLKIAQQKINNPNVVIDDLVINLTAEASSVLALLQNQNHEHVPSLIADMPTAIRADIDALNLSNKDLTQLKAKLILLHGTDDDIIPYTESIALANAVMRGQAELFLIDGLAHVDVYPERLNRWAMLRAINALLKMRAIKAEKL